jgi:hypothetical protein
LKVELILAAGKAGAAAAASAAPASCLRESMPPLYVKDWAGMAVAQITGQGEGPAYPTALGT